MERLRGLQSGLASSCYPFSLCLCLFCLKPQLVLLECFDSLSSELEDGIEVCSRRRLWVPLYDRVQSEEYFGNGFTRSVHHAIYLRYIPSTGVLERNVLFKKACQKEYIF